MVDFLNRVVALLRKVGNWLADPRTLQSIVGVVGSLVVILRVLNIVDIDENVDELIEAVLLGTSGAVLALAMLVSVVVVPIAVWVLAALNTVQGLNVGWTERPSRGLFPFLKPPDAPKG